MKDMGHFQQKQGTARDLRSSYKKWKNEGLHSYGYFPLFNGFKGHLSDIGAGALKLYLYLGLHARNSTGESWHSEKSMADFFGKDERTIRLWLRELQQRGLIERVQFSFNGPVYTFLIPYRHLELTTQDGPNHLL